MRSRDLYSLLLIAAIAVLALVINLAPSQNFFGRDVRFRLGLDLQGGIQVLLRTTSATATEADVETAAGVIERRVNGLGVGETVVQLAGSDRIIVELPGIDNPEQAVETLRGTGRLEFINSQGQYIPEGTVVRTTGEPNPPQLGDTSLMTDTTALGPIFQSITDGRDLDTSQVSPVFSQGGTLGSRPAVSFAFRGQSATNLAQFTATNIGQPMCIVLDSAVVSCPVINGALNDGSGVIETNSNEDRDRIFNQLKFGALPIPLEVETSRTVSATLGQASVETSIVAGLAGLVVVAVFMIVFYRLPGLLAALALVIYTLISFSIYRLIPITLTLPGIAGFILSIGLAVDANVLIFARLREEYRRGRDIRSALEMGFVESWPAIRDSSVSTLITSIVLFLFGNSFGVSIIKGFAVTLGLGIVVSLFTAIVVTRTFLRLAAPLFSEQRAWLFGIDRRTPVTTDSAAANSL
ncbi:protein translocase subunit SecD [Candidatus Oscillochloris fontis]|uniref:protein translocase subunit SecD n=1 Tax=Candidatus Oscillochloris fontis TaxID=2496868 RepID=UPI00101C51EB|nr:protein translocase subunit SecD [Candidatus Oscillochloris fontis]